MFQKIKSKINKDVVITVLLFILILFMVNLSEKVKNLEQDMAKTQHKAEKALQSAEEAEINSYDALDTVNELKPNKEKREI